MENPRERLLETAGAIFGQKGYQRATVREICQAAEVNIAAVNYYFGDKERLYIESVKRAALMRAEQVPLPEWPAGAPAARRLRDFVETLLLRMVGEPDPPWHLQLMMRELVQPTAACAELVRDYIRPHFEILRNILTELLPPDTSAVERHMTVFSIIGQCLYYRVARPVINNLVGPDELATYTPARLADHIAQFSLVGIGGASILNPQASSLP